jgi:hypothetical protein
VRGGVRYGTWIRDHRAKRYHPGLERAGTECSSMLPNAHTAPELSGGDHRDNRKD